MYTVYHLKLYFIIQCLIRLWWFITIKWNKYPRIKRTCQFLSHFYFSAYLTCVAFIDEHQKKNVCLLIVWIRKKYVKSNELNENHSFGWCFFFGKCCSILSNDFERIEVKWQQSIIKLRNLLNFLFSCGSYTSLSVSECHSFYLLLFICSDFIDEFFFFLLVCLFYMWHIQMISLKLYMDE